ncbi:hypothetical protein J4216_00470 [Candidatus Woesearchaeota archaeon]|nr:hypothetical protein [Candidatus Woesearchaeota archaeon]
MGSLERCFLVEKADNIYTWNFSFGEEFYLGFHGGGLILSGEDTHGVFVGVYNEKPLFLRVDSGGKLLCYSAESKNPTAWWIGEPDEGPYFPSVKTYSHGEIPRSAAGVVLRNLEFYLRQGSFDFLGGLEKTNFNLLALLGPLRETAKNGRDPYLPRNSFSPICDSDYQLPFDFLRESELFR